MTSPCSAHLCLHRGVRQHLRRGAPLENSSADVEPLPARAGGALRYGALAARYPSDESDADGRAFAGGRTNHAGSRRSGRPEPARRSNDAERPLTFVCHMDFGQSIVTRLVSSFSQTNSKVTAELCLSNRPLHMIQEGCDVVDSGRPAFRPTRARPAAVERERLTGSCRLSRSSPLAEARARLHRLRRQLHDERIRTGEVQGSTAGSTTCCRNGSCISNGSLCFDSLDDQQEMHSA
jgi:hypothetical protein